MAPTCMCKCFAILSICMCSNVDVLDCLVVIDCGGLPDPGDGQVTFTPGAVVSVDTGLNAVATYTCSEGYSLDGDVMRTCQANGQWDGAEPSCTRKLLVCSNPHYPVWIC